MSQIIGPLQKIAGRIAGLVIPEPLVIKPSECADRGFKWPAWGNESGIYSFEREGRVLYIGRALGASLEQRLKNHCTNRNDAVWVEAMESPQTWVYVFPFPPDEWYWTASVEAKLNSEVKTIFGMRIS